MTDRLLLQNALSFYKPDITKDTGNLICDDDKNFINIMEDRRFFHFDTLNAIQKAFDRGCKTVLLTASSGMGKSQILQKFAFESRKKYDAVIFTSFDKDRYLFFDKSYVYDDSLILEKCLSRIFLQSEYYTDRFRSSPFYGCSPTELLYSLSHRKSLIIIDNLNTDCIPNFVFSLCEKGFDVLIASQNKKLASDKRVKSIHHTFDGKEYSRFFFEDLYTENSALESLCSLFSGKPEALHFIKCFLDSEKYTQDSLLQKVTEITEKEGLTPSEDYAEIFYTLAGFSSHEKEILETAGVMLFYINPAIVKHEEHCFTAHHCEMYTGISRKHLKKLTTLGFIRIIGKDELYITNGVFRFIFNKLKPSAQSCRGFMKYISQCTGYKLSLLRKNYESGSPVLNGSDFETPFLIDASLLDVYAYFISTDSNSKIRLYKGIMQYILSSLGPRASTKSTQHLLIRQRDMLIYSFCNAIGNNFKEELYKDSDCRKIFPESYTPDIMAGLDIIRVCVSFIRFIHCDMYDDYVFIFRVLEKAIFKCIEDIRGGAYSHQEVTQIYLDIINLCARTFFYFNEFGENGSYNPYRLSGRTSLGYHLSHSWNEKNACSLYALHSPQTMRLYTVFYKLSSGFISHITNREASALDEHSAYTYRLTKEFCREFSSFWNRLLCGFEKFCDFYAEKLLCTDVYTHISSMSDGELEVLLKSAKDVKRGLSDKSSSGDSKNYCNEIISTVAKMKNSEQAIMLILNASFQASDILTDMWEQAGFAKLISDKCSQDIRQKSRIFAFCSEQAVKQPSKLSLYTGIMTELIQDSEISKDAQVSASVNASLLFIKAVCGVLEKQIHFSFMSNVDESVTDEILCSAEANFYLRFNKPPAKETTCEQYLAQYIYQTLTDCKSTAKLTKPLKEAMDSIIYERLVKNCGISRKGFAVLSGILLGKKAAACIINKMLDYDLSLQITKDDYETILKYYRQKNGGRNNEH